MTSTISAWVAIALLVLVGLGWIALTWGRLADGAASASWEPVPGAVVVSQATSRTRDAGTTGWELGYRYTVDGAAYRGTRASYRGWPAIGERGYRAGQEVTVYVDPASPHRAVLEPGFDAYNVLLVLLGLLPIGLAAIFGLAAGARVFLEADEERTFKRLDALNEELRALNESMDASLAATRARPNPAREEGPDDS